MHGAAEADLHEGAVRDVDDAPRTFAGTGREVHGGGGGGAQEEGREQEERERSFRFEPKKPKIAKNRPPAGFVRGRGLY